MALGGVGVTLTDLVQLYAGLARLGRRCALSEHPDGAAGRCLPRIIGPEAAWQVADILSGLPPPPGAPANRLAYKTGTCYGHRDAWAHRASTGAMWSASGWAGADGTPVPGAFGGDLAAPVLFQAFGRLKPSARPAAAAATGDADRAATPSCPSRCSHFRPRGAVRAGGGRARSAVPARRRGDEADGGALTVSSARRGAALHMAGQWRAGCAGIAPARRNACDLRHRVS